MAGSSFLSFVEGDVGGKGRRCATAPAHPHPGANSLALISTPPFYGYKVMEGACGSKDDVCEVYTVYMGLCIYLYIPYIYIYTLFMLYIVERRERENNKKNLPNRVKPPTQHSVRVKPPTQHSSADHRLGQEV